MGGVRKSGAENIVNGRGRGSGTFLCVEIPHGKDGATEKIFQFLTKRDKFKGLCQGSCVVREIPVA